MITPAMRKQIKDRDQDLCRYCGDDADDLDHVVPKAQDGRDHPSNLVQSCRTCNIYKRDRTPEEAGMILLKPGTVFEADESAAIRERYPNFAQRPGYGFSNQKRRRQLRLLAEEAAANPYNLHYPYQPARRTT